MKRGMMPAHPGEIIKETIEGLKEETGHQFTLQEIAQGMGISRKTLSNILNGHQGISPKMSVRLSEAFGTSAKFWIDIQISYDVWHAEHSIKRQSIRQFWPLTNSVLES